MQSHGFVFGHIEVEIQHRAYDLHNFYQASTINYDIVDRSAVLILLDGLKLGCLPKKHSAKSIFKRHKFWHVTSASVVFNRSPKAENDPERTLRKSFR